MRLHVRFDPPGWFATDARVVFMLDAKELADVSFRGGAVFDAQVEAGVHALEAEIRTGFIKRRRKWTVAVPAGPAVEVGAGEEPWVEAVVRYSRFWGNFEEKIEVREHQGGAPEFVALAGTIEASPVPTAVAVLGNALRRIVATWCMLGVLVTVFVVELMLPVDGRHSTSPSVQTLVALGGLFPPIFQSGEWYRAFSCTFLHANFFHLLMNGIALLMVGAFLEGKLGWRWFLFLYLIGALGGSAMSLVTNDGHTVSVGASGAIMGLFAASLWVAQTLPTDVRARVSFQLLRVLVPSLIPIFPRSGQRIDIGAHLGGALACAALGGVLYLGIRKHAADSDAMQKQARSGLALAGAGLLALCTIVAFAGVAAQSYPKAREEFVLMSALLPDEELPAGGTRADAVVVRGWIGRYPDDPRVRITAADLAVTDEQWAEARAHLARGREGIVRFRNMFGDEQIQSSRRAIDEIEADVALREQLIPNRELPQGSDGVVAEAWTTHLPEWLRRYPNDPRVRSEAAWRAIDRRDIDEAERHVGIGLDSVPRFVRVFPDGMPASHWLRLAQAIVDRERGREAQAATALRAICAGEEGAEVQQWARSHELCDAWDATVR